MAGRELWSARTDDADGTKHDNNFFFADRHEITADKAYTYKVTGQKLPQNDAHALSLFFDFGGTPGGTSATDIKGKVAFEVKK